VEAVLVLLIYPGLNEGVHLGRRLKQLLLGPLTLVITIIIIRDAPDTGTGTDFAGYPANPEAGYRISGRIKCQFQSTVSGQIYGNRIRYRIRPDTGFQEGPNYPTGYPVHP
jgi:hypothetical protein